MNILNLIGRNTELFKNDISNHEKELKQIISPSSFLVIGGAGSIGSATTKEIFKRNPKKLHLVDISENNMVELVKRYSHKSPLIGLGNQEEISRSDLFLLSENASFITGLNWLMAVVLLFNYL